MIFTSSTPRTVQLMSSPIPTEMPLVMQASQMGALDVGSGNMTAISVGIGELISCTVLGVVLVKLIESNAALRKVFATE